MSILSKIFSSIVPKADGWVAGFFVLFFAVATALCSHNAFFWDTVQLGAQHATWFYEHQFASLFLPNNFDSGHIPAFGAYLAGCWLVFGKTLAVSHWAMFPFLVGIVWQLKRFLNHYFDTTHTAWMLILILSDATLLSQSILVSPDVVLLFFMLMAISSIVRRRGVGVVLAVCGLSLVSMRGMMVAVAVFLFGLFFLFLQKKERDWRKLLAYLLAFVPAAGITLLYLWLHYEHKRWIGFHADSPWAGSFRLVSAGHVFYNAGLVGWRLIDFGRLFTWLCLGYVLVQLWQRKIVFPLAAGGKQAQLLFLVCAMMLALFPTALFFSELQAHRYLLPVFISVYLWFGYIAAQSLSARRFKWLLAIAIVGNLSGNLWIYPEGVAKGWDATLAHTPYYSLRQQVLHDMRQLHISPAQTGSEFPLLAQPRYTDLTNDTIAFCPKNLDKNEYILYSNICNSFTDSDIKQLTTDWLMVEEWKRWPVFFRLYSRPK